MLVIHTNRKFSANHGLTCRALSGEACRLPDHPWYKADVTTSLEDLGIAVGERRSDKLHQDPKKAGGRGGAERSDGRRQESKRQNGNVLRTGLTTFDPPWSL